jgi:hypothetical protein
MFCYRESEQDMIPSADKDSGVRLESRSRLLVSHANAISARGPTTPTERRAAWLPGGSLSRRASSASHLAAQTISQLFWVQRYRLKPY